MSLALIALLLTSTNTVATANQTTPTPPVAESGGAATKASEPKKICKRLELTGARTASKKLCLTAEQWRKTDINGS